MTSRSALSTVFTPLAHGLAGALLANAIPHGVKGMSGQQFPTPFSNPPGVGLSSPQTNVLWSAANLALGTVLLTKVPGRRSVAAAAGGFATALMTASHFGRLDLP